MKLTEKVSRVNCGVPVLSKTGIQCATLNFYPSTAFNTFSYQLSDQSIRILCKANKDNSSLDFSKDYTLNETICHIPPMSIINHRKDHNQSFIHQFNNTLSLRIY